MALLPPGSMLILDLLQCAVLHFVILRCVARTALPCSLCACGWLLFVLQWACMASSGWEWVSRVATGQQ